jgi:hypothetical protein
MTSAGSSERVEPPRIARSEDELIRIARGLLGHDRPPPRARAARPIESIGPTAMGLLQQTLARGLALTLLRRGGWETRRTLLDADASETLRPARGRLWERHRELPPLEFGPASFALLTWLHREDLIRPSKPLARLPETTIADDLLHYFACEQLVRAGVSVQQPGFRESAICQLGFPDVLARPDPAAELGDPSDSPLPEVDFRPWTHGLGAVALEALQSPLAKRWLAIERRKGGVVALAEMTRIGAAQQQVLCGWFAALSQAGRRDLAGFVAEAARDLLAGPSGSQGLAEPARRCPDHRWWIRSLSLQAPLSARQRAFTAAAALLHGVGQLELWLDEAGLVAHFDDDYEAAQLLLSNWRFLRVRTARADPEAPHSSVIERAAALAHTLESLHSLGAYSPDPDPLA